MSTARSENSDYAEVCQLAQNLARNCGYAVLPCSPDAQPLIPIHSASKLSQAISKAWLRTPGSLIGIATGAVSCVWVLEICSEAGGWWRKNNRRLLPTRCYETPANGVHCYYRNGSTIASGTNRIAPGVNIRADGDFIVHWFSAGLHCHDHSPPAPFPQWLGDDLSLLA